MGKCAFKIFVVAIPKEGLGGEALANPSFGMTPTIKLCSAAFSHRLYSGVGSSFVMTTTKILSDNFP